MWGQRIVESRKRDSDRFDTEGHFRWQLASSRGCPGSLCRGPLCTCVMDRCAQAWQTAMWQTVYFCSCTQNHHKTQSMNSRSPGQSTSHHVVSVPLWMGLIFRMSKKYSFFLHVFAPCPVSDSACPVCWQESDSDKFLYVRCLVSSMKIPCRSRVGESYILHVHASVDGHSRSDILLRARETCARSALKFCHVTIFKKVYFTVAKIWGRGFKYF